MLIPTKLHELVSAGCAFRLVVTDHDGTKLVHSVPRTAPSAKRELTDAKSGMSQVGQVQELIDAVALMTPSERDERGVRLIEGGIAVWVSGRFSADHGLSMFCAERKVVRCGPRSANAYAKSRKCYILLTPKPKPRNLQPIAKNNRMDRAPLANVIKRLMNL